jgi:hypothetical protein
MYKNVNGERIAMSENEIAEFNAEKTVWENESSNRKLAEIKHLRLQKLMETDFWVLRGDITDAQKLYRKDLRDIPTNYDSSKYDELLARETDKTKDNFGQLTHAVWSKP